jgi:hypothetical protein
VIGPRTAALINGRSKIVGNTTSKNARTKLKVKFYKAYSQLNIESFKHFVDESEKQGLKVVGHIPNTFEDQTEKALFHILV